MLLNVGTIFDFNETERNPRNCKNENETRNRLVTACKLSIYNLYSPIVWKIVVWRTRTDLGARDFAVSCAVVWNSLPTDLRLLSLTAATFAKHLLVFSPGFSASEDYLFLRYMNARFTTIAAATTTINRGLYRIENNNLDSI